MHLPCPCCGWRDLREFTCIGAADHLHRPVPDAPPEAWHDYLHNRANPAGEGRDLWYHDPCGTWLVASRNTLTHAVHGSTGLEDAR